jgi:hypothetical protein
MTVLRTIAIGMLLATTAGTGAHATPTTLFDNTAIGTSTNWSVSAIGHGALAESFTTDALTNALNSVQLKMKRSGTASSGSFVITVDSSISGTPTVLYTLGTISDTSLLTSPSLVGFTALNLSLSASTQYWIVATDTGGVSGNSLALWQVANNSTGATGTSGQAGSYSVTEPTQFSGTTSFPFEMKVIVNDTSSSAPEPAALAVLGVGIAGLGWARGRRNIRKG